MKKNKVMSALSLMLLSPTSNSEINSAPENQMSPLLAVEYNQNQISDWLRYVYSEKLDGIRAIWTGDKLVTRVGNQINAPTWFTAFLPPFSVEGELWAGRGRFEHTLSIVLDEKPDEEAWKTIRFMLFDIPHHEGTFGKRYSALNIYVNRLKEAHYSNAAHIQVITHYPAVSESHINKTLHDINRYGGEGIMLRDVDKVYLHGRSQSLLKLKIAHDAEADVVGYVEGNGKYEGKMGSLIVRMPGGETFKIGSGFTDKQREHPPEIGTSVTYRYNGYTKNGIPKFARFIRIDHSKL